MAMPSAAVRQGLRIEVISLGWMVAEGAIGIGVGIATHALALQAFGLDSVIELVSGAVLYWRLQVEVRGAAPSRVAAAEHRASGLVGWALLALAAYVVVMAAMALATHGGARPSAVGLGLAAAAALLMPWLAHRKEALGAQIDSAALAADGACNMVCAYMAWTVLIGLGLTMLLGWWWLNPVAGLAIVYFIVQEGREAVDAARETPIGAGGPGSQGGPK